MKLLRKIFLSNVFYKKLLKGINNYIIFFFSIFISYCLRLETFYLEVFKDFYLLSLISFVFLINLLINFFLKYKSSTEFFFSLKSSNFISYIVLFSFLVMIFENYKSQLIIIPRSIPYIAFVIFNFIIIIQNSLIKKIYQKIIFEDNYKTLKHCIFFYKKKENITYQMNYIATNPVVKKTETYFLDEKKIKKNFEDPKIYKFLSNFDTIILSDKYSYYERLVISRYLINYNIKIIYFSNFVNFTFQNKIDFNLKFDDILDKKNKNLLNNLDKKFFDKKKVFVCGGAGSIGSEIINILNKFNTSIIAIDVNEENLFNLNQKFKKIGTNKIHYKLIDINNLNIFENLVKIYRPDIIINAAAYKHVDLVQKNSYSSLFNNVNLSKNILYCSKKYNVTKSILVSSDKAVNPTNIMGVTKRIVEALYLNNCINIKSKKNSTIFSITRFGNVIGSSGSLFTIFRNDIKKNLLSVRGINTERYLMRIDDAAELVVKTVSIGKNGSIYIYDMGKPFKILNLAKKFIRLHGLTIKSKKFPEGDVRIKLTNLLKGEKSYEELNYAEEGMEKIYRNIFEIKKINFKLEEKIVKNYLRFERKKFNTNGTYINQKIFNIIN